MQRRQYPLLALIQMSPKGRRFSIGKISLNPVRKLYGNFGEASLSRFDQYHPIVPGFGEMNKCCVDASFQAPATVSSLGDLFHQIIEALGF